MPFPAPIFEHASRPDRAVVARLADPGSGLRERLDVCRYLIEMGALEEAAQALAPLTLLPAAAQEATHEAAALLRVCRKLQGQSANLHEEIDAIERNPAAGDWWAAPAGAATTIVAFSGAAQKTGISVYFLRRILARLGCNVLVLFDTSNRLYLRGVAGLGASVEETASLLRPIIDGMRGRRLICLGQSAGGFGAIRYGRALGADGILAFSPLVHAEPARRHAWLRRHGLTELGEAAMDLRAQRLGDPAPPRLHIVCGAEHARDMAAARSLADMPGVSKAAIPGLAGHGSLQACVVAGTFVETVSAFLAEIGVTEPGRRGARA